jgi:hypothetical protein
MHYGLGETNIAGKITPIHNAFLKKEPVEFLKREYMYWEKKRCNERVQNSTN